MRVGRKILAWLMIISPLMGSWAVDRSAAVQRKRPREHVVTGVITVERVFPEMGDPCRIKSDQAGNIYVLGCRDHSIAVYDRHHKFIRRIGRIGNGPGEFTEPFDFAIGQGGDLYVADTGNQRVQVLDSNGKFLREFRFRFPESIAVLSTGEILVVGSHDEQLIRVFSSEGKYLRTIGTPVDLGLKNRELNAYLNRGKVYVDGKDNIYYLFLGLLDPVVRKYNAQGKLLLEIRPEGTEMSEIRARARAKLAISMKEKALHREGTLNALQTDPLTGNIWIAPSGPVVYVYSGGGVKLAEYRFQESSGRKHLGIIDFVLVGPKGYFGNPAGCFVFDLPRQ
jgi:hypothetical protein